MKLILSLNKKERLYDYVSMGIDTFVLGGHYSFYAPYNFSLEEISQMIEQYSQCSFYVAMNALYDEHEIKDVEYYIDKLVKIGIKGLLFQDFGVLQIVKKNSYSLDMMYAPETLNTNAMTLKVLKQQGVTSAQLARVIPLEEQLQILQQTDMPLMLQVHGVEYIAASKRALLTNYQQASHLQFDLTSQTRLTIQARNSEDIFHIYEDQRGTHIFSQERLYMLDLLNQIHDFEYLYIETLMMDENEAVEVASLYSDALKSFQNNTYDRDVKSYMNLLYQLKTPLHRGFLFDQTVYKLEDVRKMDHEKSQSNH